MISCTLLCLSQINICDCNIIWKSVVRKCSVVKLTLARLSHPVGASFRRGEA
jgi:hypothetical protein